MVPWGCLCPTYSGLVALTVGRKAEKHCFLFQEHGDLYMCLSENNLGWYFQYGSRIAIISDRVLAVFHG